MVVGILAIHFKLNVYCIYSTNFSTCTENLSEQHHFSFLPFWSYEITKLARNMDFSLKHKLLA